MPVCRSCSDDKPAEEFPFRSAKKGVRQRKCLSCCRAYARAWYEKNAERHRRRVDDWRKRNPEKIQEYRRRNPDKYREWDHRYRKNNPHVRRANNARYKALKREKTLPLTKEEQKRVRDFYKRARDLTVRTGVRHEVDHVLPLSHPLGFHHPDNMQVIPADMNRKKSNKLTLDRLALSPVFSVNAS